METFWLALTKNPTQLNYMIDHHHRHCCCHHHYPLTSIFHTGTGWTIWLKLVSCNRFQLDLTLFLRLDVLSYVNHCKSVVGALYMLPAQVSVIHRPWLWSLTHLYWSSQAWHSAKGLPHCHCLIICMDASMYIYMFTCVSLSLHICVYICICVPIQINECVENQCLLWHLWMWCLHISN